MQNVKNRLAAELAKECNSMDDVHNMLKDLWGESSVIELLKEIMVR